MKLSILLFIIGILGFVLNRKNIILMIIAIEIMLLSVTLLVLIMSYNFDDNIGQIFSIYILSIAGAESVIGLSILVAYYRLNISLLSYYISYNKPFVKNVNKSLISTVAFGIKGVRNYSTIKNKIFSIDPWFITGLFDAESSFVVTILKNPRDKTGWRVQARVQIKMHEIDRALIVKTQEFFLLCYAKLGIGYISKPNNRLATEFRVNTLNDIVNIIIPHFNKYPLLTKKQADFILFKEIILLMLNKEHSTLEGVKKIVKIKASLNTGLTTVLKEN
jgi:NADH:ubiquinone oxidoreductase subunit K